LGISDAVVSAFKDGYSQGKLLRWDRIIGQRGCSVQFSMSYFAKPMIVVEVLSCSWTEVSFMPSSRFRGQGDGLALLCRLTPQPVVPAWLVYAAIRIEHPSPTLSHYPNPNSLTIETFKMIMITWSNAGQERVHCQ